jgi:hypothetical protein
VVLIGDAVRLNIMDNIKIWEMRRAKKAALLTRAFGLVYRPRMESARSKGSARGIDGKML